MSAAITPNGEGAAAVVEAPREKLTKKALTADHPTWCPGCGDFAVLAAFYKVLEKRQLDHEKIDSCGHRMFVALPLFREWPRRTLHSWTRCAAGHGNKPRPA